MDSQNESHGCELHWRELLHAQVSHLTRHILKRGMVALCSISLLCQQGAAVPMLYGNAIKHIQGSSAVAYHYDAWSRLTNRTLPNGVSTVYQYDEYGGVSNITHYQTPQYQKVITGFTYIYNQDGSIAKRVRINGLDQQAIEQYGYDDDNNLKDYQCSGALCPHDAQGKVIRYQHYTFDGVNNIKTVTSNNTLTTYEYDQQIPTRLMDYHNSNPAYPGSQKLRYDRNGNILQYDQGNVITYDPLDQTRSVSTHQGTTTYFYNGEGQQVGEDIPSGKTTYLMYGQSNLLNTRVGSQQTSFLYGANRLGKQDDEGTQYYLKDQGRSVVNTVDQTATQPWTVNSYAYSPYGIESNLTKQPSNIIPAQHFGFDGQLTDGQSNWQFLGQGYRAYNSMLHRFMSQDSMSPFDKGGINGYVFGGNNPIMMSDPSGHFSFSSLIPNTPAGWLGFGASMLAGGALALALEPFLAAPISIEAGIALSAGIAGTSNAAGVYAEQSVETHNWIPNKETGKKMAAAFWVGAAMDMAAIYAGTLLGLLTTFEPGIKQLNKIGKLITKESNDSAVLSISRDSVKASFETEKLTSISRQIRNDALSKEGEDLSLNQTVDNHTQEVKVINQQGLLSERDKKDLSLLCEYREMFKRNIPKEYAEYYRENPVEVRRQSWLMFMENEDSNISDTLDNIYLNNPDYPQ